MTVLDTIKIILAGDTAALTRSLTNAGNAMERAGRRMTSIGSSMATRVSLPILAVGGASVKMAADFDASLRKIVGLVGVQREVVNSWREDIRKLAVQYGQSAGDAANALFFITSAGLRGADAMNTLEATLKGSAAGMGDLTALADAATSAMNAYGVANLSAERAVEILTGAVRAGKLETEALAPVIGRILPTASAMGVGLEQVAGILAVFSRTGTDAAMGATSLQAVMSSMLKPGNQAKEALASIGMTMEQLREIAAGPEGVIGVMRLLDQAFAGNDEALAQIIPNVRAFRGVMAVLAQDSAVVDQVMSDVANSVGIVDEAFTASQGPAFRMKQAWESIKDAFITLGDVLIPIAVPMIRGISNAVVGAIQWFNALPKGIKIASAAVLAFVAALGPLLLTIGAIVTALGGLIASSAAFAVAALPVVGVITLVVGAVVGMALGVRQAIRHWDFFKLHFFELWITIKDFIFTTVEKIIGIFDDIPIIGGKFREMREKVAAEHEQMLVDSAATLLKLEEEWGETASKLTFSPEERGYTSALWDPIIKGAKEAQEAIEEVTEGGVTAPPAWVVAANAALKELQGSLRQAADLNNLLGASFDLPQAQAEAYQGAIQAMVESGVELDTVIGATGITLRQLADKYVTLTQTSERAQAAELQLAETMQQAEQITASVITPTERYDMALQNLMEHVIAGRITWETYDRAVQRAKEALAGAGEETEKLDQTMGSFARRALDAFVSFTNGASDAFKRFVDTAIQELQRLAIRAAATKFFEEIGIKIPGMQHGGYLGAGHIAVVGEAGPELIQAGRGGVTVTPASQAITAYGGGSGGVGIPDINLHIHAVDPASFAELVERDPMVVTAPVVKAIARSNALRAAIMS